MMQALTSQQAKLLAYLKSCERTPSYSDMQIAMGMKSKSGVHHLIDALEERGYIERIPNRARCIRVLEKPRPMGAGDRLDAFDTRTLVDEVHRRLGLSGAQIVFTERNAA